MSHWDRRRDGTRDTTRDGRGAVLGPEPEPEPEFFYCCFFHPSQPIPNRYGSRRARRGDGLALVMNENEIQRIAAAANQLRPDWPTASLRTLLNRPELRDRPRRDVAVALAWVACETDSQTPARVLEAGPWWRAAAVDEPHRSPIKRGPLCIHCGFERHDCEKRWKTDHAYEGPEDWMRRRPKQATDVPRVVEALKAELQPTTQTATPPTHTTEPKES